MWEVDDLCGRLRRFFSFGVIVPIVFALLSCASPVFAMEHQPTAQSGSAFIELVLSVGKSTLTIVSFAMSVLFPFALYIKYKIELSAKWKILIPFFFFSLIFTARLLLYTSFPDIFITIFIIVVLTLLLAYILSLQHRIDNVVPEEKEVKPEVRACRYIDRYTPKCHPAIESIQLYSVKTIDDTDMLKYQIDFIDGQVKCDVEINALLSTQLSVDRLCAEEFNAVSVRFFSWYRGEASTFNEQDNLKEFVRRMATDKADDIKTKLSQIKSSADVSNSDCAYARVRLVYLSMLAALEGPRSYIGLEKNSLGLSSPNIEPTLFTKKRTGLLGAILLDGVPYVFCYMRNGSKCGRFYYAFTCGTDQHKYAVLIAVRNKDNKWRIENSTASALEKIERNLRGILDVERNIDDE